MSKIKNPDHKFIVVVKGPKEYLPKGQKVYKLKITQKEIEDTMEDGETEKDAINYLLEEETAAWAQSWCKATVFTEEEFDKLQKTKPTKNN
jgi:hypothetical protein